MSNNQRRKNSMNELDEIFDGLKTLDDHIKEYKFQLGMGEHKGGQILSDLEWRISTTFNVNIHNLLTQEV